MFSKTLEGNDLALPKDKKAPLFHDALTPSTHGRRAWRGTGTYKSIPSLNRFQTIS